MAATTINLVEAGQLLRGLREARGLSRPDLAELSGAGVATIRNAENAHRSDGIPSRPYGHTLGPIAKVFGPDDGARLLEAFGYDELADTVFSDDPDPDTPTTLDAATLGISNEQAVIINRLVEGLIELARSGNTNPHRPGTISVIRAIPRYEVSADANHLRLVA